MNALVVLLATTALGIEVGWEPLPGGGHEYTLQIEPQLLKVLEGGQEEIFSEVPAGVDVRRYRIVVGVGKLRRDYGPLESEIEPPPATAAMPGSAPGATAAPQAAPYQPLSPEAAGSTATPAEDPYHAPSAAPAEPQSSTDLEAVPPVAEPAAPDFGLPTPNAREAENPATAPSGGTHAPGESNSPADDLWHNSAEQPVSEGQAEQITVGPPVTDQAAHPPAKLPESQDPSEPIRPATFEDPKDANSGVVETGRPELPNTEPQSQPWTPLVVTMVLLACSLGGNIFLGWIAADARARYRNAVAKFRGAAA
jgi:hypothetical protein